MTSKANYVAVSHRARERIWMQRFLNELLSNQAVRKMEMLGDNKISLILIKNPESQNYTKYIDVIHHHIWGLVDNGELGIKWIWNSFMLADGLTEALHVGPFKKHQDEWSFY